MEHIATSLVNIATCIGIICFIELIISTTIALILLYMA